MSRRPRPHASRFAQPAEGRQAPELPQGLGDAGSQAWTYVWGHSWLNPDRHRLTVERYCRIQDLLGMAFDAVSRDGLLTEGSHKQLRSHPAMAEIRLMSTESRLIEIELGLTPAAESKAGVPSEQTTGALAAMIAERQRPNDERDDFRFRLRPVE